MAANHQHNSLEALKTRLGIADNQQIQALLKVPPEQRIIIMLKMQAFVINMWRERLQQRYPELNDLDLCRLMFDRLQNNEKYHGT
jgi:hypothetical protein